MDLNHTNYRAILPQREHDLPLDQVLKPRHYGKKLPSRDSSDSKPSMNVPKLKPISKDKTQQSPKPQQQQQVSSTDLVRQLIFDQSLKLGEIEELMVKLKNIKSLKKEKLTEKVREALVETVFSYNYQRFMSIMYAFSPMTLSSHFITAIFNGFVLAWKNQPLDSINYYMDFFKLYCQQIPHCINKPFLKWLQQRAKQHPQIYPILRAKILDHVKFVIKKSDKQRSPQNQKIIGLVEQFKLMGEVDQKEFMRVVPLEKINEYVDNDNLLIGNQLKGNNDVQVLNQKQQQKRLEQKEVQKKQSKDQQQSKMENKQRSTTLNTNQPPQITVPPLLHTSILQLLRQNNLKQTEKVLRSHKIPHTHYPQFVQKLQLKYLEYIERTYPIYFVDQLIYKKISLVENFVDMCLKRKKYDYVDHFINKYLLRGVTQPIIQRIIRSPLTQNDTFGPTQSHVLNQYTLNYFSQLSDFNITPKDVIWIDAKTIHRKPEADFLIQLLYLKEVGIDSESTSGIHVFERARLEIIQVYDPVGNVVVLFDVRDLKGDKKKRMRKSGSGEEKVCQDEKKKVEEKNIGKQNANNKEKGKSINEPIDLEEPLEKEQKLPTKLQSKSTQQCQKSSNQKSDCSYQKAWTKFTKVFQNLFKRTTIYGHCLHSDLGDIIQELDLKMKPKDITFIDSQAEFKKYFPQQTKSKLGYLTEKCFGKELSKYEQCSAWDKRPLRQAQKHYAALDAVLPYRLVKWMEVNGGGIKVKKGQGGEGRNGEG